ncbi:10430_t:CDS:1, partial [Dentiscutata heterogama]
SSDSFTLKLSDTLEITRGLCNKAVCLNKLVEMYKEFRSTDELKDKTSIML